MSGPGAATWSCPACERRVPSREDVCHCGYDRRRAPVRRGQPEQDDSSGVGMGRLLAALGVLVFGAVVFVAVNTMKGGKPTPTRPAVEEEPSPASETPTADVPSASDLAALAARATLPPAPVKAPTPSAPPTPLTGVDLARQQAHELLDPLIGPIAKEADALDFRFRYYLETCRADFTGAPPVGAGRYWFVVWISRAQIEWSDDRPEPGAPGQADAPDCRGTWVDIFQRAANVADALERFEETAKAKDVPSAFLDQLLAAHRLTGWRESYFRRRPSGAPPRRP